VDSTHTLFGLTVRSNLPLPGLESFEDSGQSTDLTVHLGDSPYPDLEMARKAEELTYESSFTDDSGRPALRIWRSADGLYLRLAYYDGMQFWLECQGKEIWAIWPEAATLEDASSYLLGPVLGVVLRLRGVTSLHASAVAMDGYAVAFVGAEGAGKSTTAAAFAREGHGVLSDDVVALTESESGFVAVPAYPHLCLWPDSVAALFGSADALPHFSTGWEKHRLALGEGKTRFEKRRLPLGAIYVLGERRSDLAPFVEAIRPQPALLTLVANTFANKILSRELRSREFEVLSRLVTAVPIRRVFAHSESSRISDLCRAIREDFASLKKSTRDRL
jgi:hypothetical protein